MTYAFRFDAKFCSGCKACQAACKDKNNLPPGVLWRRVYEVTGGDWQRAGDAWTNTVFAYNVSLSCNHCLHPKCAGVCPTNAYQIRDDGIVVLDTEKCVGCGYCAWACPYGVPQYNPVAGYMTKCDFCFDQLDRGLPPACVAACPMRVLDYGETDKAQDGLALWETRSEEHPFPLPAYSHTQPQLLIKPHPAMTAANTKSVANLEEIRPQHPSKYEELPLVLFTIMAQMAVGGVWAMIWMFPTLWSLVQYDAMWLRLLPSLVIGASLGIGMVASFAHLGTKRRAWRVLANLRRSSISKEILFLGLFGSSWLLAALDSAIWNVAVFEIWAITAIFGLGLVYNMAQVYRIPAAPGWNTWRTNVGFFVSAVLLGLSAMIPVLAYEAHVTGIQIPEVQWAKYGGTILILLLIQLILIRRRPALLEAIRIGMILGLMVIVVIGLLGPKVYGSGTNIAFFLFVVTEELIGRWAFYQSRT